MPPGNVPNTATAREANSGISDDPGVGAEPGDLNPISRPWIQDRIDPRTTDFFSLSMRSSVEQSVPDVLEGTNTFRAICLSVEPASAEPSSAARAETRPLRRYMAARVGENASDQLASQTVIVRWSMPKLHKGMPIPLILGDTDGPSKRIIDMYPIAVALSPEIEAPAPGDPIYIEFTDRVNMSGPIYKGKANQQSVGAAANAAAASGLQAFLASQGCGSLAAVGPSGSPIYSGQVPGAGTSQPGANVLSSFSGADLSGFAQYVLTVPQESPTSSQSLSDYLRANGVDREHILSPIESRGRRAPRNLWKNMVPTARFLVKLEDTTTWKMIPYSVYRPESTGQHSHLRALDIKAEYAGGSDVSYSDWVNLERLCMDIWETEDASAMKMGLGFYLADWEPERMIHIDIGHRKRRWTYGPDAGPHPETSNPTSSTKGFHDYIAGFPGQPRASSLKSQVTDVFWAALRSANPPETEENFRAIFDPEFPGWTLPTVEMFTPAAAGSGFSIPGGAPTTPAPTPAAPVTAGAGGVLPVSPSSGDNGHFVTIG